jgi:hypothetical protein
MICPSRDRVVDGWAHPRSEPLREWFGLGLARALKIILAARDVDVPDHIRERFAHCDDLELLQIWIYEAATADRIDDLFRPCPNALETSGSCGQSH